MTGGGVSGPGVGLGLFEMHVIFQCVSHESSIWNVVCRCCENTGVGETKSGEGFDRRRVSHFPGGASAPGRGCRPIPGGTVK